jgi:hypothetical protein
MGTLIENKRFEDFKQQVLKYEIINNDELSMLIRRYTSGYMGRRFFNDSLKHKYYTFWIKRLHTIGILKETGSWGLWKVQS